MSDFLAATFPVAKKIHSFMLKHTVYNLYISYSCMFFFEKLTTERPNIFIYYVYLTENKTMPKNLKQTSCKILVLCDCNALERANREHLYWPKNKKSWASTR